MDTEPGESQLASGGPLAAPSPDSDQQAAIATLYNAAIAVWTNEGAIQSGRLNALLVSNTIFLGVIAAVFTTADTRPIPASAAQVMTVFAAAGFLVTVIWLLVMMRSIAYSRAYMAAAKYGERLLRQRVSIALDLPRESASAAGVDGYVASTLAPVLEGEHAHSVHFSKLVRLPLLARLRYESAVYAVCFVLTAMYGLSVYAAWFAH